MNHHYPHNDLLEAVHEVLGFGAKLFAGIGFAVAVGALLYVCFAIGAGR